METISVTYKLKWRLKDTSYCITKCKKIINNKTGRIKKKTVHNGTVGFWIGRKFMSLKQINSISEKLIIDSTPF
jgi:hypothetical protein